MALGTTSLAAMQSVSRSSETESGIALAEAEEGIDFDNPKQMISLIYQIIMGGLVIVVGVPFAPVAPISQYGDWWWVGLLFIISSVLGLILFLRIKGEAWKLALIRPIVGLIVFFAFTLIMNSLWEHGVFIWMGYLESVEVFFSSDVVVTTVLGLASIALTSFFIVPTKKGSKEKPQVQLPLSAALTYSPEFLQKFCKVTSDGLICDLPIDRDHSIAIKYANVK